MKRIMLIALTLTVSCSGGALRPDLQTKAVYSANLILQDDNFFTLRKPFALYFKRLDNPDNLRNGTIIRSDMVDDNGYVSLNAEPGTYTIIAAAIRWRTGNIIVVFNDDTMNRLKTGLKAGEIRNTGKIHIMYNNVYILEKTDETQMYNLEQISKNLAFMPYEYRPGYIDRILYPSESAEEKSGN